jgi:hypothetical protein
MVHVSNASGFVPKTARMLLTGAGLRRHPMRLAGNRSRWIDPRRKRRGERPPQAEHPPFKETPAPGVHGESEGVQGSAASTEQHSRAGRSDLKMRPRDRRPVEMDVIVMPGQSDQPAVWLWLFTPRLGFSITLSSDLGELIGRAKRRSAGDAHLSRDKPNIETFLLKVCRAEARPAQKDRAPAIRASPGLAA